MASPPPSHAHSQDPDSNISPTSSESSSDSLEHTTTTTAAERPKLSNRKSSGTIIVSRDAPNVEIPAGAETFDADDARTMSPRRDSADVEKISQDARAQLYKHAKNLHESLLEIFNRIEAVKEEHDKLDSNNKFLQKYIGDLMSTSKITATGSGGRKK